MKSCRALRPRWRPAFADVWITDRTASSAVALVHGASDAVGPPLDFTALAKFPGTLVFYMGVTTAHEWSSALVAAGKSPDTPAAIVRRCSWPDQVTIRCTLATIAERLEAAHMRPPVIVIVGEVAQAAHAQSWFTSRPLFGRRILITRPLERADVLWQRFAELGAVPRAAGD